MYRFYAEKRNVIRVTFSCRGFMRLRTVRNIERKSCKYINTRRHRSAVCGFTKSLTCALHGAFDGVLHAICKKKRNVYFYFLAFSTVGKYILNQVCVRHLYWTVYNFGVKEYPLRKR